MSTHIHKSTCHIVRLLLMLCAQMTHYPPLTTLELCDSDPRIDLYGLLSRRFLVASPGIYSCSSALCNHCHTHSLPIHHQHRCTHARATKHVFAGLDQESSGYSRPEIPIDGELHLVGMPSSSSIALITIKQRQTMLPQAQYQASNDHQQIPFVVRCAYLFDRLCDSSLFVLQAHMDVFVPPIHVFLSHSLSLLLHPVCCYYSPALFILVLILTMMLMVCAYYSIVNPPARITSSCIWRVTTSTTGRRTRPRIAAPEQRYLRVSISLRKEKNVRDLQTRG